MRSEPDRPHSPFDAAFTAGARLEDVEGPIEMTTRTIGELEVRTGRIGAGDPLTTAFENPALGRLTPTGSFPVEVAIAQFEDGDARVACARIRFGPAGARAVKWELDPEIYGVDAGMGCFFDEAARTNVGETTTDAWLDAMKTNQVDTWTWHVAPLGGANIVMFSSGWGDGAYASYWGVDAAGALIELVTDFEVLTGPRFETVRLPLPLERGRVDHPLLAEHDVTMTVPWLSRSTVVVGGTGTARLSRADGTELKPVTTGKQKPGEERYDLSDAGATLVVSIVVGGMALERI